MLSSFLPLPSQRESLVLFLAVSSTATIHHHTRFSVPAVHESTSAKPCNQPATAPRETGNGTKQDKRIVELKTFIMAGNSPP